jgi:hypothetical protein
MSNFFGTIAAAISEGIEEGRLEAQRRAAEKAEYQARLDKVTAEMDVIVNEGVRRGFIKRKAVAYHFCPELKRQESELVQEKIKNCYKESSNTTTTSTRSQFDLLLNPDSKYEGMKFATGIQADNFMEGLGYKVKSFSYQVHLYSKGTDTAVAQREGTNYVLHF